MAHPDGRIEVWLLVLLLAVALGLRLVGLDYGLPFALIPGEMAGVPGADGDPGLLIACRLLSAALSVATVWLVWRLARELFTSPIAGLIAAALLATSWYAVVFGHMALGWSAASFALWLVVWRAYRWFNRPTPAGIVPLLLALALAVIAICWLAPSLTQPSTMGGQAPVSFAGFTALLLRADPVLAVAGVAGALLAVFTRPVTIGVLTIAFVLGLIAADRLLAGNEAALVPLLPILALGAGGGAAHLAGRLSGRRPLALLGAGLAVVILAYPLATAGWMAWLMTQDDTRLQARAWLQEHAPADLPIVVDMAPVTVETNSRGLEDQAALAPGGLGDGLPVDAGGLVYRALHINDLPAERVEGDAGFQFFDELVRHGYLTYLIAVRPDRQATNFQIAALESTVRLDEFVPSFDYRAPPAPDFFTGRLATVPVWRFFLLERLGPPTSVAFAAYATGQ